jgi:hypothetical protein
VRISEVLDSRFTKSRTGVSLSLGRLAQFGHRRLVVVQAVVISAFSVSVKRDTGRVLRMFACERDPVGIVYEAMKDGISDRRGTNHFVPLSDR